jgi:hypothetical protein
MQRCVNEADKVGISIVDIIFIPVLGLRIFKDIYSARRPNSFVQRPSEARSAREKRREQC